MRLGDLDKFKELFDKQIEYGATDLFDAVEDALQDTQIVDPETLPIVQELRKKADRLEEARENANEACAKWEFKCKELEQQLSKVTAERDELREYIKHIGNCSICKKAKYISEFLAFIPCEAYIKGKNQKKWVKTPYGETVQKCQDFEWKGINEK
ncbi:MAG: hypothetical protein ACOX60_06260 [Massiliimalia sp.]|jgi:DNA repair ATPase RecN